MVKFDNLDYRQQRKLEELYTTAHPQPEALPEYKDPAVEAPRLVQASGESRVFVEVSGQERHNRDALREALVRLVVQVGKAVFIAEMTIEAARLLNQEMLRVTDKVAEINAVRAEWLRAQAAHEKKLATWELDKSRSCRALLAGGTITGNQIMDAESWSDLAT